MPLPLPHVQAAAVRMAYSEYAELSVDERAAVLSALATLALGNEVLREHFNSLAENMPPRQLGKVTLLHLAPALVTTGSVAAHSRP